MRRRTEGYARWSDAVEWGGVGHTARAFALLDDVDRIARAADDGVLASLSGSTRASLLRQAGRHRLAATIDGRALLSVGGPRRDDDPYTRAAVLDAVVGLAADHLGQLHLTAARGLLQRARRCASADDPEWLAGRRPRLRIEWVSAELAMYSGDPTGACTHADAALLLAAAPDTPHRHRVKTSLIAAAAMATAGRSAEASDQAAQVGARAAEHGLLPLEWASSALRTGLNPSDTAGAADLARLRADLIRRGVPFEHRMTASG